MDIIIIVLTIVSFGTFCGWLAQNQLKKWDDEDFKKLNK